MLPNKSDHFALVTLLPDPSFGQDKVEVVDILEGNWHKDSTHLVDEFSSGARLLMMFLVWSGCLAGTLFGLILFLQTVMNWSYSPINSLILLEQISGIE